jgi:hypothetical protein
VEDRVAKYKQVGRSEDEEEYTVGGSRIKI